MSTAQTGDTVRVEYVGRLQDGSVFDSSAGREPLEFTLGSGQVIAGFERAVTGMEIGETRETRIPPEEAYGPRRTDLVLELGRDQIPSDLEVELGTQLQLRGAEGQSFPATVTDLDEQNVTIDANHPLAGEELLFEIRLLDLSQGE